MAEHYAHSENSGGQNPDLVEHLKGEARLAAQFAGKFGAADIGYRTGCGMTWGSPMGDSS